VTLTLKHGDQEVTDTVASGDGPVDAMFLAIERITGVASACKDFRVQAVTVGKDAQAEVNVELERHGRLHRGRGVSTDSLEASAKAFLNAINRVAGHQESPAEPAQATP
jgi:2-isopropylmalate synthase